MDYVNLVRFDRIKDKITEVRNDNDARVRFVDLTTLKRRVRQRSIKRVTTREAAVGLSWLIRIRRCVEGRQKQVVSDGPSSCVAAIKCSQFFVRNELASTRGVNALADSRALLVGQTEHILTPPLNLVGGLCHVSEQFLRQSGNAFKQIMSFRTHRRQLTPREFTCPACLVYGTPMWAGQS